MATEKADWTGVLAEVPLFAELSKRHLRKLAEMAKFQRYDEHATIVARDRPGDSFFVVVDGTVTVQVPGKRSIPLGPGDYFGELALLDDAPRSATVVSGREVLVARIWRKDFLNLLQQEPKVSVALLRTLAGRLRASEKSATN